MNGCIEVLKKTAVAGIEGLWNVRAFFFKAVCVECKEKARGVSVRIIKGADTRVDAVKAWKHSGGELFPVFRCDECFERVGEFQEEIARSDIFDVSVMVEIFRYRHDDSFFL